MDQILLPLIAKLNEWVRKTRMVREQQRGSPATVYRCIAIHKNWMSVETGNKTKQAHFWVENTNHRILWGRSLLVMGNIFINDQKRDAQLIFKYPDDIVPLGSEKWLWSCVSGQEGDQWGWRWTIIEILHFVGKSQLFLENKGNLCYPFWLVGMVTVKTLQDTLGLCAAITPKRPIHHQNYETIQHYLAQAKTCLFPE